MKRIILFLSIICLLQALMARPVMAIEAEIADASAIPYIPVKVVDVRIGKLESYLASHNSPMTGSAAHFVAEADRLGLDWRLVAAIAGVESTFGKHVPAQSFNGWGWGIPTGASAGISFASWNNGITTVSEGLKYRYIDRGAITIEQMGRIYAASPAWSYKVRFFINSIEKYTPRGIEHLEVTI